jgi:Rrf2 family transcriptional regulator, iron-sulfur cluster assembly transcription factor
MKITALHEYGMRCLLQLAAGGTDLPQTTASIALKEGLSRDYVEKILFQLRKAGIVKSVRGINGGYILARSPEKISMGEVIMALSGKPVRMNRIKDDLCKQYTGNQAKCVHLNSCAIRMVWSVVMSQVYGILNRLPLSDLIGNEIEVQKKLTVLLSKNQNGKPNNDEVLV